jgi:hypothetical protein
MLCSMPALVRQLAIHPVLLGAYFVLFLYAENLAMVRIPEVVPPLAWVIGGSALVLGLSALLFRSLGRGALVASALVVAFMAHGRVAEMAGEGVSEAVLIGGWAVFIAAAVGLAAFPRTPVASLTGGLNVVAVVLLVFVLSSIVPHVLQAPTRAYGQGLSPSGLVPERTTQRDIFYLVFDRYGSQGSLEAAFGITDNDLPQWLAERGFTVLPQARANYSRTSLSLASVLNMEHLDGVAQRVGSGSTDLGPLHAMLNDHRVGRFLREQGYRYIHIGSWFNPTRRSRVADEVLEFATATEFEAVLYETTAMPLLEDHFGGEELVMPPADRSNYENALFQFRALNRVLGDPGPKFVYAHVLLPHDPYVFDEDGRYVSRAERADESEAAMFRRQLEYTNRQIKAVVERMLALPESRRPIIIVGADEGPHPEPYQRDPGSFNWADATPDQLETKFGILSAFYLPTEPASEPADLPQPYPSMSAVNTFRFIFARYFGLDLPYLPDRSYTPRDPGHPYDLTDVTDRLPAH